MKTKNNGKLIFIISCALCLCIGLTLGKLFNWGYFTLNKEISILDALSLFVTIGLAIYITHVLEKQVQNRRIEKDLLLAKISDTEQCVITISNFIEENDVEYFKLISLLKSCNKSTNIIFKTIEDLKLKSINKNSDIETNLKGNIRDVRRLSTNTSISSDEEESHIDIEDGIIKYSDARIIEIERVLDDMKDNYFKLKFMVNME